MVYGAADAEPKAMVNRAGSPRVDVRAADDSGIR
jgi:hypothetical protein